MVTIENKMRILSVLNIFETGQPDADYSNVTLLKDATDDDGRKFVQITYGRHQTTEQSHLKALLEKYVENKGMYATAIAPFLDKIGTGELVTNGGFLNTLRSAGKNDSIMRDTQDTFFDAVYYQPAFEWFEENGFTLPLSMLVVYDSFIHSGGILDFLRKRFSARTPKNGGTERMWVRSYTRTRNEWLIAHPDEIIRKTAYRTAALMREIDKSNWLLNMPIVAQGKTSRSCART